MGSASGMGIGRLGGGVLGACCGGLLDWEYINMSNDKEEGDNTLRRGEGDEEDTR